MDSVFNFNDIYDRLNILNEAKASVSREFPGLKEPWKRASMAARESGASAPTREAKNTVLGIIAALVEIKIGRELTVEEERGIMYFKNVPSQSPLIEYLTTQEIDGRSIGSIVSSASEEDIKAASEATGIADGASFQMGQRGENKQEKYKQQAADRAEAKKAKEASAQADAAGEAELADSFEDIGKEIVGFAKGAMEADLSTLDFDDIDVELYGLDNKEEVADRLVEILKDAGYTVEKTPAGINAEAPVGTFGTQEKAEDLMKGLIMKLFPNISENQVRVYLNTNAGIEDGESPAIKELDRKLAAGKALDMYPSGNPYEGPDELSSCCTAPPLGEVDDGIGMCSKCKEWADFASIEDGEEHRDEVVVGAMVLVNGEWYAVDAVDHEVSTVVYASNKDGQEFEFTLDDIESVDTSSVEIFTDPPAEDAEETVTESYTSQYVAGLPQKSKDYVEPITESVSFRDRFQPKTSDQLAELRKYGL